MSDNNFQFGDAQNQVSNNANLSSEATAAWSPLSIVKKEIGRQVSPQSQQAFGKTGGAYSDYAVHDWKVHKQNGGIDSLREDDGPAVPVRTENLGADRFGNPVIGINYKTNDAEVRMVMHTLENGQFLGMENCITPQACFTDIVAGSPDDAALKMNMKQLADPTNVEHQFLMSKLTELNQRLGAVQQQATPNNLEQMLNKVEQMPTTSPVVPQYQQNYNNYPVQNRRYSYQGNYQTYPTNDQLINQNKGAGFMNTLMNGAMRFRNTHDGSFYHHIPVSNGVERPRPSVYQGQYNHIPANDGTKDVSAILEAKRQRLIREGRLPIQQPTYESGQQSNTQTNVYGQLEKH